MTKQNNSKLIKSYEGQFTTELWWNDKAKCFDIWRNKAVVRTFKYQSLVLFDDMLIAVCIDFDEWFDFTEKGNLTLNQYLERNNIKLTQLELECLQAIVRQGSFYEESALYDKDDNPYVERGSSAFIGWYIDEVEVPGCRGGLSSLEKKGIIEVGQDEVNNEVASTYYTLFSLEFDTTHPYYHTLKIDSGNLK